MTRGKPTGQGAVSSLGWGRVLRAIAALPTHYYLDILAKEAGMEAEPVGGDVEPALEKEVPLQGTGTHWEVTGEKTAMSKVSWEAPGPGSSHSEESRVQPQRPSSLEPRFSNNPSPSNPQNPKILS